MSGERILNFKPARSLGKNILQKETRISFCLAQVPEIEIRHRP